MCGACPGGGRLTDDTRFLAHRLSPTRTAQFVAGLTGDRLRISQLGDGWSVSLPTGNLVAATDFESLVRHCAPYVRADAVSEAHDAVEAGVIAAGDAADAMNFILERLRRAV